MQANDVVTNKLEKKKNTACNYSSSTAILHATAKIKFSSTTHLKPKTQAQVLPASDLVKLASYSRTKTDSRAMPAPKVSNVAAI